MGDVETGTMEILLKILKRSENSDTKLQALEILLGFTASSDGLETIYKDAGIIFDILIDLMFNTDFEIAKKVYSILINISAEERGAQLLVCNKLSEKRINIQNIICNCEENIVTLFFEQILSQNTRITEQACIILSNMSRKEEIARKIFNCFKNITESLNILVSHVLRSNESHDYLVSFLSNLSQLAEVRKAFLNSDDILEKVLMLISFKDSAIRRKGAVGIIRNLCFSVDNHEILLRPELDILSRLLLPLAGPEEFDDEDNEKLPLELQYLPENKIREEDPEIRKMLIEILIQLCTTRFGRNTMRENNIYIILREYHKWEKDRSCIDATETLVNFLIRTEEEIGTDNLQNIEIPPDLMKSFNLP